MTKLDNKTVEEETKRLKKTYGNLAVKVIDELISASELGYDYDAQFEIPFYTEIKKKLQQ